MIILVRHAQSEGNKNRDIHQYIPDHRVKLTPDGRQQAEEAGRRLRSMLRPDDTIQFFTSPYRRTRETTEGILKTLTADDPTPSPFQKHKIKVYEEPRLREQDFGNFQPCSAEMERMWQERADYGHFFYRIPNGESAADAYDRVSGFNESLWRSFGEEDFPSVCVLVTHGLMTRVFLMKWYHWSVEYFEDLRNVNHCEFIIMKQNPESKKYVLENQLRTWSDLRKRAAAIQVGTIMTNPSSKTPSNMPKNPGSPTIPMRRWGGCPAGCNHETIAFPRRTRRQNTGDFQTAALPPPALNGASNEMDDHPIAAQQTEKDIPEDAQPSPELLNPFSTTSTAVEEEDGDASASSASDLDSQNNSHHHAHHAHHQPQRSSLLKPPHYHHRILHPGSGPTEGEGFSDDSDYGFLSRDPAQKHYVPHPSQDQSHPAHRTANGVGRRARSRSRTGEAKRRLTMDWEKESGMGVGARADTLGDGRESSGEE
ncbi:phosphoglycerate mutase-like protein, partial [Patellaria atrata CBS 101060]